MGNRNVWTNRNFGNGDYKKSIMVIGEGVTEHRYFTHLKSLFRDNIHIECPKPKHSSPNQILRQMKSLVDNPNSYDEAWIVIDHDGRSQNELKSVIQWSHSDSEKNRYAMSNPKFEYWLLLHFDEGNKLLNANDCSNRLAKALGIGIADRDRIKRLDGNLLGKFTCENIERAIERAKSRDNSETAGILNCLGSTTVYLLAEVICNMELS